MGTLPALEQGLPPLRASLGLSIVTAIRTYITLYTRRRFRSDYYDFISFV